MDAFSLHHYEELAKRSAAKGILTHTPFLSDAELSSLLCVKTIALAPHIVFGGKEGTERNCIFFLPDYLDEESGKEECMSELSCIRFHILGADFASLTHRDALGALMGLGMEREQLGDIYVGEEDIYCYCLSGMAKEALSLELIGRYKVKASEIALNECPLGIKKEECSASVASLRLDCLLAAFFHLSREEAKQAIIDKRVLLSSKENPVASDEVEAGDKVSLRGKGKVEFLGEEGTSRKGKIRIRFARYI